VTAFWLFGLCNNFPYVIMLSAAFDILSELDSKTSSDSTDEYGTVFGTDNSSIGSPGACRAVFNSTTNASEYKARYCNTAGTSVILLADIVPTLIIKLTLPYVMNFAPYWIRIFASALFSALSFVLVGVSVSVPVVIVGVACASISSGLGEITFLSFTAHYHKTTISGWGSGTGGAGIGGALVYAGLRTFLSAKVTILLQLVIPVFLVLAYLFLLTKPAKLLPSQNSHSSSPAENENKRRIKFKFINREEARYFVSHVKYVPHLVKFMIPLYLVYISEYMINQGLFELLYYKNTRLGSICLDRKDQYRWYQVVYQLGVFISRSSLFLVYIKWFWILAILQVINFVLFFLESIYLVLPSFWLTFFLVLYEGLLGGGVYVNAFYSITKQVPKVHREFSMGVASVADSFGITSAGIASIFIHNFICHNFVRGN
jgi:battenin